MSSTSEMLTGTPLLLRMVGDDGQESLQICKCRIDPKGQTLKWTEQDGKGRSHEVRLNAIAEVLEERSTNPDEEQSTIRLNFKGASRKSMELICASREDLETWRDGLRSLVDGLPSSPAKAAAKAAAAAGKRARTVGVDTDAPGISAEGIGHLLERLQLQEELISELRQENGVLNEMVKQKDTVISQLTRDLQSRGTKAEQCNKTESTSRESDDHLRDRETALLKRKNLKLKKLVGKKQQTITNLMQTLQSALGGQASDADMLRTEDDADEVDSDDPQGPRAASPSARNVGVPAMSDSGSEPEDVREEMAALTGKLARLERDVEELNLPEGLSGNDAGAAMAAAMLAARGAQASPSGASPTFQTFQPPARTGGQQQKQQQPPSPAQQRAAMAAAARAGVPQRGMAGFDFSGVGGAPAAVGGMSAGSKNALAALEREMAGLEEKKRLVEELAKQLEPPSDNDDEDDGFPLQ